MADRKLIIFDLDGVISDSFDNTLKHYNQLAGQFGLPEVVGPEVTKFRNMTIRELIDYVKIPKYQLFLFLRAILQKQLRDESHLPIHVGIRDTLHNLKKEGHALGIVSLNSPANVQRFLQRHEIEIFDYVESVNIYLFPFSQRFRKPGRINDIVAKEKISKELTFYVGDQTSDIDDAKSAIVRSVAVSWGYNTPEVLEKSKPDFLIHKPHTLLEIIN